MVEWKRPGIALEVLEELQRRGVDCRLLMIGDGPERKKLEAQARRSGLDGKVVFTGFLEDPAILYPQVHMAVLPSFREPFGLVVLEYYSFGIPVLVMEDGGGICEIVGRLHPEDICRDVRNLADRAERYLLSGTEAEESRRARRLLAAEFSIARMAGELAKVYRSMVEACAE